MMDMGSLLVALNGMKSAKDLAVAALEARDASRMSTAVTQLNTQIINAQQGVLDLQASMLQMLSENQRLQEEIRGLKAAQDLHTKYQLATVSAGNFAYQLRDSPQPLQYICQPCLDVRSHEVVLRYRGDQWGAQWLDCPECETSVLVG